MRDRFRSIARGIRTAFRASQARRAASAAGGRTSGS